WCEVVEFGDTIIVHVQAAAAFKDLFEEDYSEAKSKYDPIAELDRSNNPKDNCVNQINIARCIVDGIDNDRFATPYSNWISEAYKPKSETEPESGISIFPNPARGSFTVKNRKDQQLYLEMYNLFGQKVKDI